MITRFAKWGEIPTKISRKRKRVCASNVSRPMTFFYVKQINLKLPPGLEYFQTRWNTSKPFPPSPPPSSPSSPTSEASHR